MTIIAPVRSLSLSNYSPGGLEKGLKVTTVQQGDPELHRGQLRFAVRYRNKYGGRFLYAHGIGWHEWDGTRWAECLTEGAGRAVEELLQDALAELPAMEGSDARKSMLADVHKIESAGAVEGVLQLARKGAPMGVAARDMNRWPTRLNTPTGTLDLETGELAEHNPADHITKLTGVPFDLDSTSQVWDDFLAEILPDEDVRSFVQRLFGYALLGEVREHVLPIFTGTGANGKGTLRDAIKHAMGDYAIEVAPDILLERRSDAHKTELMDLQGARLVFASETDQGRRFAEATMKRLVGGDNIRARRMHKDTVEFRPSHTLVMLTNKLPEVSGDDPAVWRRLLVVPFDVVIPPERRDGTLSDRLRAEGPAILAWIHEGWLDYLCQGLAPPDAVRARTEDYRASSDALGRFLEEECVTTPAACVQSRALYHRYERWCTATGERSVSEKEFGLAMAGRPKIVKRKSHGTMVYDGIGLRAEEDEEPSGGKVVHMR